MLSVEGTESTGSGRQRSGGTSVLWPPECHSREGYWSACVPAQTSPPPSWSVFPTCSVGPTELFRLQRLLRERCLVRLQRLPARRAASSLGAPLSSLSARSASPIGGFPHSFLIEWPLLWVESRLLSASSSGVPRQFTSPQKSTRRREGALCPHPLPLPPLPFMPSGLLLFHSRAGGRDYLRIL